jgi:hypothetical protein
VWGTSENSYLPADERKKQLARCVSHLCHVQACVNPQHLASESAASNKARQICSSNRFCNNRRHGPEPCMLADEFPDTALEAHFAVRTKSVTFEERLSQVEQARLPQPVVAIPELVPSPIRRQLQSASQNSPSIESLRALAATLSDFLSQPTRCNRALLSLQTKRSLQNEAVTLCGATRNGNAALLKDNWNKKHFRRK